MIPRLWNQLRSLKAQLKRNKAQTAETKTAAAALDEAVKWMLEMVQGLQAATHARLADVVSRCLVAVFGPDAYRFVILFEGKGKVRFAFERGGEQFDPDDQVGGGVLDVAAFALRVAAVVATRSAKVLVLDEPFRFVSRQYRPAVADLLSVVSQEFGIQIIQVTHASEMIAGVVIRVGKQTE